MDFAADLPLFYFDFGQQATHTPKAGGASTEGYVLFDQPGLSLINGEILAVDLQARFAAIYFPNGMRRGDSLVIDGVTYQLREGPQPVMDGLEYTVPLQRV